MASDILSPILDFATTISTEGWTSTIIRSAALFEYLKPWEPIFFSEDSKPPKIPALPEAAPASAVKLEKTMQATGATDTKFGSAQLQQHNRWRAATGKPSVIAGGIAESASHFLVPTQALLEDLWETVTAFSRGVHALYQQISTDADEAISMQEFQNFLGMLFAHCGCTGVEANLILGEILKDLPFKQRSQVARIACAISVYEQQLYVSWNDASVIEALEWWQQQGFSQGGVSTSLFSRGLRESGLLSDPNLLHKVEGALVAQFGHVLWRRRFLTHFVLPMKGTFLPQSKLMATKAAVMEFVLDHRNVFKAKDVCTDELHVMDEGTADPATMPEVPLASEGQAPPGDIDFETGALLAASWCPEKGTSGVKATQAQFRIFIRDVFPHHDPQPDVAQIVEMSEFLLRHRSGSPMENISAATISRPALPVPHHGTREQGFGQVSSHEDRAISGDLPWLLGTDSTCDVALDGLQESIRPFHALILSIPRLRQADEIYAVDLSAAHRPTRLRIGHGQVFALRGGLHITLGNSTVQFVVRLTPGDPSSPPQCVLLECSAGPGVPKRHEVPLEGFHFGAGFGVSESKSIAEGIPDARISLQSGAGVATIHGAVWYSQDDAAWLLKDLGGGDTFVEMRPGHAYPLKLGYEVIVGGVGFFRTA
eukprot:gnl/MRDRNA2_/MRDRNA2_188771_c0_seq1.p1 gnl/MRDRNA2_/MRDRNA2_188771_c0~~gnl/MRDRNA2_/MRDRNA2_188771_c0_seq1.p1  ORF type:complete len:748 (-),score=131.62 gnl/MRDRNA2_/MRDRNA2_188771_c0_seq1:33-1994(-)